jgi:hypothetical protein
VRQREEVQEVVRAMAPKKPGSTRPAVDPEKVRARLRGMSRGDLLIVAERAVDLVPRSRLAALVGDSVRLEELAPSKTTVAVLLDEVKRFEAESLAGKYYESFAVNSKNFMDQSLGTERFIAEFDRLVTRCTRAASKGPRGPVREAFKLLFALLRHIDAYEDDVIFFADEGGSWQVGVDWQKVLPAYFRCLAETAGPEEFAREVEPAIRDFAEFDRSSLLTEARRLASEEQKAALRALPPGRGRR